MKKIIKAIKKIFSRPPKKKQRVKRAVAEATTLKKIENSILYYLGGYA